MTYTISVGDISTIFTATLPDPYFEGNPIIFDSDNMATSLIIGGYGPGTELNVIGEPNIRLVAGTTTMNIIGDLSGTYRLESERPMVIEAGDTTVVIYG